VRVELSEFLGLWEQACDRKQLPKLLAEVLISEGSQTQAARLGREHLFACALGPWEADDVLSEIALLTITDDGDETWRLRRLSGQQAASIAGGRLSAHFARSFIHATRTRAPVTRATRLP
jgi:hypothetical protein